MIATITFENAGPNTIWGRLTAKLGREPTNAEAKAEVQRILEEGAQEQAAQGKLWFQGRRP